MKNLDEYKLIILDVDGTLYFQRKMQFHMGIRLIKNILSGKEGIRELRTVLTFRRIREKWNGNADNREIYLHMENLVNLNAEMIRDIVEKWIYHIPLEIIRECRDDRLANLIAEWVREEKRVVYYSDHPLEEKIKALELPELSCYYSGDEKIRCFKPDPKGIQVILEDLQIVDKKSVLMIGDRTKKDGKAAALNGVDFLILKKGAFFRRIQYQTRLLLWLAVIVW